MMTPDSAGEFPVARDLTASIWDGLDGDLSELDALRFTGVGDVRSPFAVADFAAATFAAAGLAVNRLLRAGGHGGRPISVDRLRSAVWFDIPFAPSRYLDAAEPHGIHAPWMTEFQTSDDRWIRVQATYPTLRARMLSALGVTTPDPGAVATAVQNLTADEAEQILVDAGAAVAQARSLEEWRAHPQGLAVAEEPIGSTTVTTTAPQDWAPLAQRPLHGVRVLDLSRVVAAPMATRFLASLGAEVLRIDAPDSDEANFGQSPNDVMLGKRWALLDIRTPEGRARYEELIATCDIMVHSYRPGAIDALGPDEFARAELRPGLVEVALDAYGWTGPWRARRGFDTLVQYATGIAHEVSRWANEDPERRLPLNALGNSVDASRPRHLPVEALDFGTGYQVAAAAIRGLARRLETGAGSITRLSLARSSHLLTTAPPPERHAEFTFPIDTELESDRIWSSGGRPSQRIVQPLAIDEVPLFWERPAEPAGASNPVWASTPARWSARPA